MKRLMLALLIFVGRILWHVAVAYIALVGLAVLVIFRLFAEVIE